MAQIQFDATQKYEVPGRELLPAGDYVAQIVSSELKTSNANPNNEYVELVAQIQEGPYRGKTVVDRVTVKNDNPTATQIGFARLQEYCQANGINYLNDTQELHANAVVLTVTVQQSKNPRYGDNNAIDKVSTYGAPQQQADTSFNYGANVQQQAAVPPAQPQTVAPQPVQNVTALPPQQNFTATQQNTTLPQQAVQQAPTPTQPQVAQQTADPITVANATSAQASDVPWYKQTPQK